MPCSVGVGLQTFQIALLPLSSGWSEWRWRQQGPPKPWYPTPAVHGITIQKTLTWIKSYCL